MTFGSNALSNLYLKKRISSNVNNYRLKYLTATLCKLIKSIFENLLVHYLVDEGLVSKQQYALITNHSTVTNLVVCINDRFLSLKSPNRTDVFFNMVDFCQVF